MGVTLLVSDLAVGIVRSATTSRLFNLINLIHAVPGNAYCTLSLLAQDDLVIQQVMNLKLMGRDLWCFGGYGPAKKRR